MADDLGELPPALEVKAEFDVLCPVSRPRTGTTTPRPGTGTTTPRVPSENRDYFAGTGTTTPRVPSPVQEPGRHRKNRDYFAGTGTTTPRAGTGTTTQYFEQVAEEIRKMVA